MLRVIVRTINNKNTLRKNATVIIERTKQTSGGDMNERGFQTVPPSTEKEIQEDTKQQQMTSPTSVAPEPPQSKRKAEASPQKSSPQKSDIQLQQEMLQKQEEVPAGAKEEGGIFASQAEQLTAESFHGRKGFLVTSHTTKKMLLAATEAAKVLNDTYFGMAYNAHRIESEKPFKEAIPMYIDDCTSALFIALKPDDTDGCPTLLVKAVLDEAASGTWAKLDHVARIIPVEVCCDSAEYAEMAKVIVSRHFKNLDIPDPKDRKTFSVHFEQHCSKNEHTEERSKKIVEEFASHVPADSYRADLTNPSSTIVVVECGNTFFAGVCEDYEGKMKKCNVSEFIKAEKEHHLEKEE